MRKSKWIGELNVVFDSLTEGFIYIWEVGKGRFWMTF